MIGAGSLPWDTLRPRSLSPLAKGKSSILLLVSSLMFLEEDKIVLRVVYDLAAIF